MIRRICTLVTAAALLVATPAVAAADPSTWTGGTHQQAINFVIARALSQRGVPFTYGGGGVNGPSMPPAGVAAAAPGMPQQLPQIGTPSAAQSLAVPQATTPANSLIPALTGLAPTVAAGAVAPAPTAPGLRRVRPGAVRLRRRGHQAAAVVGGAVQGRSQDHGGPGAAGRSDLLRPRGAQSVALFVGNGQMVEGTEPTVTVSTVRTSGMDPYLSRIIEWQ